MKGGSVPVQNRNHAVLAGSIGTFGYRRAIILVAFGWEPAPSAAIAGSDWIVRFRIVSCRSREQRVDEAAELIESQARVRRPHGIERIHGR